MKDWVENDWRTRASGAVKNRDLWELLLEKVTVWKQKGLLVRLWHIRRGLNKVSNRAAKAAADFEEEEEFRMYQTG